MSFYICGVDWMDSEMLIWLAVILGGILLFYFYARTGRFFRCAFTGAITGLSALAALWIAGHFLYIAVSVTPLTVAISVILGVPGVIGMLVLPVL